MSWKSELRLSDLPPAERVEILCRRCGKAHYEAAGELVRRKELAQLYVDEAERILRCKDRGCSGGVRLSRVHNGATEGFVGGMA